jgi:excinuclease UvrABC nuclease subunit
MADASPALYAFVESGEVMYVGKTKRHLKQRLYGYLKPGKSQRTNVRVRARVLETLNKGDDVEILGFHDPEAQKIGRFRLNMAAALENS